MLEKVYQDRLAKLEKVRSLGFDPYGGRYDSAEAVAAILARFKEGDETQRADAAGRLVLIRDMGKMIFAHLRDQSHEKGIQIALRKNALSEKQWELAKCLDLGDLVAAEGPLTKTRTGEITVFANRLTLLCKSLLPMPEKFHGLVDVETRYRQRYLDLMTNRESLDRFSQGDKIIELSHDLLRTSGRVDVQRYLDLLANRDSLDRFFQRAKIIEMFRELLRRRGFVEVETPILQGQYGGAAARPFVTHHNTLDADLYLRISPELFLKRLLVGGMERVYEFSRVFRNEGIDTRHNPEFTLLELYQAYADYEVMMEITEEVVSQAAEILFKPEVIPERDQKLNRFFAPMSEFVASLPEIRFGEKMLHGEEARKAVIESFHHSALYRAATLCEQGRVALPYGNNVIDYTPPWPRQTYDDLLVEHAGVSMRDSSALRAKARALGIEESNKDDAIVANLVFAAAVEPALAKMERPVFVKDYPAALCPLTRRKADDPGIALRFELYIAGMEIANAYTELNDPAVQEANFRQQVKGEAEGETMRVMDEDFVTALRHGMPPAGGLGIGMDRVVMLLTNTASIRDVILFPMLRREGKKDG